MARQTTEKQQGYKAQQLRYTIGYVAAAVLTFVVIIIADQSLFSATVVAAIALAAGAIQVLVQTRYFLHLPGGKNEGPRWKLHSYWFTWLTLLIIVIGSMWILTNMNYNMGMSPEQMEEHMRKENAKGF